MKAIRFVAVLGFVLVMGSVFAGTAAAQSYSAGADIAVVNKYIWRGQRLSNDFVVQPALTVGTGGFAFNAWGNMELTDVNAGDVIPSLKGKFSEIDYTFSYDHSFENVSVGGGVIFYTFPDSSASLPATSEIYGGVTFDSVPASPSVTVYVDVDETRAGGGTAGLYVLLGAGHSFETGGDVVPSVDVSGSISFTNGGFNQFYYAGGLGGGAHDVSLGLSAPVVIDDNWSITPFATYTGLVDTVRSYQYTNPTYGTGTTDADTVIGGVTLSLSF